MSVRGRFRSDGAKKYEDVESGLNRMTIAKFEHLLSSCNLEIKYKNYEGIMGVNSLTKLPQGREFFTSRVTAILIKAT